MTSFSAATTDEQDADRPPAAVPRDGGRPHGGTSRKRRAWRAYFEATALLQDRLERSLREDAGLHLADYNLLLLLVEAPDHRMRMGELAGRMVFSPSRLTYQVRALERRGLVERCAAPGDRRGAEAVLTDEGRQLFRRAAALHARDVDALFLGRISDQEAAVLLGVFSRLGEELDDVGEADARRD
ncbi:MarR family transcriptional regulator [Tersicoccus solisilvae]|uniref:MarR family transcriptional regulator n=1 Tax=Tersicoccus solisilvae TaxID=1882339 RepID=A0ABQ1PC66_9MICC|nr:MarR family transcriptional regulator [Tersicoccus solisilvae]GGC94378.1 MarR family transcriptional regulator [Tersicoccus solisilvae]